MNSLREDLTGQRQLRFHLEGPPSVLHLFKSRGESTHHVYLKVLAFAFWQEVGDLSFDPRTNHKLGPAVASLDWAGAIRLWVHVGALALDKLEHVLRHSGAEETCWVLEADGEDVDAELEALVQRIRRHIHYKYTDRRLRVLLFAPLETWFEPSHVTLPPAHYRYHSF